MANNPYVNKVVFGSATLVDLTGTTATADKILSGYGAYGADGAWMDGTATSSSGSGAVWQDAQGYVHLSDEGDIELQTKTVTPSETAQTVAPDAGYYALDRVNVGAISSSYVGSGVTRQSSSDLTASGATVTAPAGYYASSASKSVATGTAGTPTATKGTVSNHSVSVTPSVTNSGGYITGGAKTGTAVSVSASELVSGTKSITENGTGIDVTNYASVDVDVPTGGGASNVVGGTYTTGNGGSAETITLPYTGNGFPMQIMLSLAEGAYNSSGTAYNTIHQYGLVYLVLCKINTTAPTYAYDASNTVTRYFAYKNSATTANTLGTNSSTQEPYVFSQYSASSSGWDVVVQINSSTALSVYVSSDSGTRGLMPNTAYNYSVVYSE